MDAERFPVVILAGGKSTRLGRDKASELLAGVSLLQRALDACAGLVSRHLIVTARGQTLPPVTATVPIDVIEDEYPETGPLGGIYTGLATLSREAGPEALALVLACDLPLLQPVLLRELLRLAPGHDAVVPVNGGLPEPLCAVYRARCNEPARRLLDEGSYKVAGLFERVETLLIAEPEWRRLDPDGLSFLNVNREEELRRALELIEEAGPRGPR
jgi:molybdopterin-guanine dinucleotide biosynthesis protein A